MKKNIKGKRSTRFEGLKGQVRVLMDRSGRRRGGHKTTQTYILAIYVKLSSVSCTMVQHDQLQSIGSNVANETVGSR